MTSLLVPKQNVCQILKGLLNMSVIWANITGDCGYVMITYISNRKRVIEKYSWEEKDLPKLLRRGSKEKMRDEQIDYLSQLIAESMHFSQNSHDQNIRAGYLFFYENRFFPLYHINYSPNIIIGWKYFLRERGNCGYDRWK